MLDGNGVPLVQVAAQLEIPVDRIAEGPLAHLAQPFGQVVHDQAVPMGEKLRAHLRDFPAGNVGVEAVEERRVDHRFGERGKQVTGLHQGIDWLVNVADEHHRGVGVDRITAPGKGTRRHVVLHDLDAILVLERNARHFVEGHHIPQADQPDLPARHVIEQVGDRGLPARDQNAVRADFLVDVALAGAARPQFGQIVVVLDQRDQPGQQMPLHPLREVGRLHAGRPQQGVDPLRFGERPARLEQFLQVHVGHLDRLQVPQQEG